MSSNKQVIKNFKTKEESEEYLNHVTKSDYGYYEGTKVNYDHIGLDEEGNWSYGRESRDIDYEDRYMAEKYFRSLKRKNSIASKTLYAPLDNDNGSKMPFICYAMITSVMFTAAIYGYSNFETFIPAILFAIYLVLTLSPMPRAFKYEVITMENGEILTIDKMKNGTETKIYTLVPDPIGKLSNHFDRAVKEGMKS